MDFKRTLRKTLKAHSHDRGSMNIQLFCQHDIDTDCAQKRLSWKHQIPSDWATPYRPSRPLLASPPEDRLTIVDAVEGISE